jgi:hypothetical protein
VAICQIEQPVICVVMVRQIGGRDLAVLQFLLGSGRLGEPLGGEEGRDA